MKNYDIFVIGGGINGCGIARDAAGRGYTVGLAEMNDLASGTSSWSTKLIHGGLRYLEHYEFKLVRHALMEREVLWRIAPHIIRPLRFILPHHSGLRPKWLLRLGLFLYDHIGGRKQLKATDKVDLSGPLGEPLKNEFKIGFEYSDARVDDARLVVLNARSAKDKGADIMVRTKLAAARRENGLWHLTLRDTVSGEETAATARFLVNTGGPWVDLILRGAIGRNEARHIRLVQGSHIVTKQLYAHDRAYIFQNSDGRIIFTIPYEGEFTLVGTTDQDYQGDPGAVAITDGEIDYLLASASEYFKSPVTRDDIVWTFSGVRPLFDDGASKAQEATRDYVLRVEGGNGEPGLLNCFGGKITTYRVLAEDAMKQIEEVIGKKGQPWSSTAALPGGDFPVDGVADLEAGLARNAPQLEAATIRRLVRAYGTDAASFVGADTMGKHLGHGLYAAEVDFLIEKEWAVSAEDVLWRRSKLGLRFSPEETAGLAKYMDMATAGKKAAA
ncbi:glycerol-3-phosphate dehydrogenase [Jiella sp. MQZ9-1]|uniref:Glycerol-3-phosphate dehydrogenase n=1 Tax=Jiella flava TaxID=2816857 RepID=A0A939JWD1_9HYPH|nr:glycerol-3-phosphate dehydrogenase [Jiella flava]MBO0662181.1 glycerol-3-phosphate dehydrogenase [Jiella flava]MCD2470989.1 glycerol-3-phosphate dehydrogenase [Jiella flava]